MYWEGQTALRSRFLPCKAIDINFKTLHRLEGAKLRFQSLWVGPWPRRPLLDPPMDSQETERDV